MTIDLTEEETATLLRELDTIIDGDRYFLSPRIRTLTAIRANIRPEPVRDGAGTEMTALAPTAIALAARIGPSVMPHCRGCPTEGPRGIVPPLASVGNEVLGATGRRLP
jgi:hypothetical protein